MQCNELKVPTKSNGVSQFKITTYEMHMHMVDRVSAERYVQGVVHSSAAMFRWKCEQFITQKDGEG